MDGLGSHREREGPITSLVFPTFNPGPQLEKTWQATRQFLAREKAAWEVLFVCDGCTDGSPARLRDIARADSRVSVIDYAPNRGKGYAVRRGLAAARGAWRVFTDVDLAYRFEDIARLAEALRDGAPVAIASRQHADSRLSVPPSLQGYAYRRHLQSRAFSFLVQRFLPLQAGDTQAGLKGVSAAAAERLLPALACDGFGFDCELLLACAVHGLNVTEIPVSVRLEDRISTTGMSAMVGMIGEIWKMRKSWLSGKYSAIQPANSLDARAEVRRRVA